MGVNTGISLANATRKRGQMVGAISKWGYALNESLFETLDRGAMQMSPPCVVQPSEIGMGREGSLACPVRK